MTARRADIAGRPRSNPGPRPAAARAAAAIAANPGKSDRFIAEKIGVNQSSRAHGGGRLMSGSVLVVRRQSVDLLVDGLSYSADGVIGRISQKCYAIPTAHCIVSSMGAGLAGAILALEIGGRFTSFDDVVDGIESALPHIVNKHRAMRDFG
jgi:hypothetical protein